MKYCTKCGKELMDEAVLCIGCGCLAPGKTIPTSVSPGPQIKKEERTHWLGWPIIGLAIQVLLFILICVPGTVRYEKLGNDLPPNEIILDVSYAPLYQYAFSFNWASVTLIVSMIVSAIIFIQLCRSRGALREQIIAIIAAVAECIAYIGCKSFIGVGISVWERPMTNFDGIKIVGFRYELGPVFYIQLFIHFALLIVSILGCVLNYTPQQKPSSHDPL